MPNISLKLQLKPKVVLLQQLTIKLLNLHAQDLTDFLQEQVTENPLMDIRYPDVKRTAGTGREKPIDNIHSREESLEDMLMKQLRVLSIAKNILMAAGLVIQSLDEKGFFTGDLDSLGQGYGLSLAEMQQGLAVVQHMDPAGIGAGNICEALLLQAKRREQVPPHTIALLEQHYEDFLKGKWQHVQREMGISARELDAIRNFLKTLSLHPAEQIAQEEVYVRADAEIVIENGKIGIRLLEEVPEVFFRDDLYAAYSKEKNKQTQTYIHKAKRSFLDMQTALAYRQQSILTVLQHIADKQEKFFFTESSLLPLTQKQIAIESGLSESTVSRVCKNRYVLFHSRIYALQDFFAQAYSCEDGDKESTGISDQAIRKKIKELIQDEDPDYPYSDQQIAEHLQQEKIKIARRTVAKFRMDLGYANSHMRKRMKE